MSERIKIGVVDDHPLYRDGVAQTLKMEPDFLVIGTGANGREAVRLVEGHKPDVMLLDMNMPEGGVPLVVQLSGLRPELKIVILTVSEREEHVSQALMAGARGYLLKGVGAPDLLNALRCIVAGESYVMPELAAKLLTQNYGRSRSAKPAGRLADLNAREEDILNRVANGNTNKEIARDLVISEKAVKHYMTTIMQKLHVRNRVEAASILLQTNERNKQ